MAAPPASSEDCLTLNVWTPAISNTARLPTMPANRLEAFQFDGVAKAPQFADHLSRAYLFRLDADGGPALFVADAIMPVLAVLSPQRV